MSRFFAIALATTLGVTGCNTAEQAEQSEAPAVEVQQASFNADGNPTVAISVPKIHCDGCAAGVVKCLKESPGVVDVTVDAETKVATVAIDEEAFDADEAIASLAEASFQDSALVEETGEEATAPN